MRDGKALNIGFHGINCPKWGQHFALEAAQFTERMVRGKRVEVGPEKGKGKVRMFAPVSVEGKPLSKELLREGLAWWSQKYAPDDSDLAEAQAQVASKGRNGKSAEINPVRVGAARSTRNAAADLKFIYPLMSAKKLPQTSWLAEIAPYRSRGHTHDVDRS
jgi:endonuclease YncB( thermonuclease family)